MELAAVRALFAIARAFMSRRRGEQWFADETERILQIVNSLTPEYFDWVVQHMADLVIQLARRRTRPATHRFHWESLFKGRARSRTPST